MDRHEARVREAVGVFKTEADLLAAIDELLESGFDRAEISLLASEDVVEKKLGHRYTRVANVEDDAQMPRACYVSPESVGAAEGAIVGSLMYVGAVVAAGAVLISGGPLAAAIAGMAVAGGGGALVGSYLARLVGERHAAYLQEQLDRGGLLLWARTWNADDEARAVEILSRHSGVDVHVHGPAAS